MESLIKVICWTLFFVLIAFEFSPYISTKNIFKKLAILGMAISILGVSSSYYDHKSLIDNLAIFIASALIFFAACTIRSYCGFIKNKHASKPED